MWTSFVNLFLNLLLFIYKIVGNFGVAIIIFTILIKLLTHPLMKAQIKSSKLMAELNSDPEYLEMQEKYKNDRERLAQEQMKIYQKKGINPTASCLPTFIQLPIIFALYQAVIAAIVSTPLDQNFRSVPDQPELPVDESRYAGTSLYRQFRAACSGDSGRSDNHSADKTHPAAHAAG